MLGPVHGFADAWPMSSIPVEQFLSRLAELRERLHRADLADLDRTAQDCLQQVRELCKTAGLTNIEPYISDLLHEVQKARRKH